MDEELRERRALRDEDDVRERRDADGTRWRKVYSGSGEHLKNWLEQTRELVGKENVEVERVERTGLACFDSGEGLFRIWVRASAQSADLDA